jgi:probable HAF family extracellular repeat protein
VVLLGTIVSACGGDRNAGAPAGGGRTAKLLAEVVQSETRWVACALEDQTCDFTGTREVRYGANDVYAYRTLTGPVACDNAVFGDPLPGVDKACSLATDTSLPTSWTFCANEDQTCVVSGNREVRYGASGKFAYRAVTGPVQCSNAMFGDPAPGVDKTCSFANGDTPPAAWIDCALEDQQCAFTGTRQVRYGANGTFAYQTLAGPVQCGNGVFGDPLPGVDKACGYAAGDTGPGTDWKIVDLGTLGGAGTTVADINDAGAVVGASQLADGRQHAFVYRAGQIHDLGALTGDDSSEAVAINNLGIIVGNSSRTVEPASSRAFRSDGGGLSLLVLPFAATYAAHDINDAGDILLAYYYTSHAGCGSAPGCNYVVRSDSVIDLENKVPRGLRINNAGLIAAHSGASRQPTYLYNINDGSTATIASLPGGAPYPYYMIPTGLNNHGDVIGYTGDGRLFYYHDKVAVDATSIITAGVRSLSDINDNGDIAGAMTEGGVNTVFLYTATERTIVDLNALPAVRKAGWTLGTVKAINNARQIVGQGVDAQGRQRGFLLTRQ